MLEVAEVLCTCNFYGVFGGTGKMEIMEVVWGRRKQRSCRYNGGYGGCAGTLEMELSQGI